MKMLQEIMAEVENGTTADEFMQNAFETKKKLMGFGHRVYKNGDHRAGILRKWGLEYCAT